jgi:hypothetical protein
VEIGYKGSRFTMQGNAREGKRLEGPKFLLLVGPRVTLMRLKSHTRDSYKRDAGSKECNLKANLVFLYSLKGIRVKMED